MDDLWGNAWSDPPPQPAKSAESPKATTTAWKGQTTNDDQHEVPALSLNGLGSLPTWDTSATAATGESGLSWGVSTLNVPSGSPLWGPKPLGSPKLDGWGMEELGKEEEGDAQPTTAKPIEEEDAFAGEEYESGLGFEANVDTKPLAISPAPVIQDDEPPTIEPADEPYTPPPLPTSTVHVETKAPFPSPPGSPDAFGGFESGHTVDDAWSTNANTFRATSFAAEDTGWSGGDSHWGPSTVSAPTAVEPPEDEWGAPREAHARAQAGVSQVALDNILAEWSELSLAIFPPNSQNTEDDDGILEDGLEQVPGLVDMLSIVAPSDPMLPPAPHIPSTSIHKQMASAIKLTRHIPISNLSPLNQLFASKGSTAAAWEHAVRTHVSKVSDDWSWMGGKPKEVLEAEEKQREKEKIENAVPEKKGLLASLWGRGAGVTTPAPSPVVEKPAIETAAPAKPATPELPPKVSSDLPLPSPVPTNLGSAFSDARRSSDSGSILSQAVSTPSLISTSSTTAPSTTSSIEPANPPSTTSTAAPQSAVSRFLGRFTRSRTPTNAQFGQSVSLSDADLSFLEEVPTIGEDEGPDEQMKAFEDLLGSTSSAGVGPGPSVLTKRPASMVAGRMPVPVDSPPRLAPPPKPPKTVSVSPVAPLVPSEAGEKEDDDIWAVFEKPAVPVRKSTLPVIGRPGSVPFGAPRPGSSATPIARMATKHTTGSSTASLPPILAPPPRLSAPPSRSVTPLPPSPATTSGFAVPAIPPPNPPPLITPSIISRRAANGSSPLTTSGPSFAPSKPSSTFDDFGDFLDSGGSNSNTNSTAAPTPSDPFFSLGSPLAPTPTTANKPALSPIVTRPSPVSASANGFGSFSMGDGNDGFGDFMSPVQAQPTPPATQFATLAPIPTNVVTLGMPSPRITAPDTPLYPPDPNKPLPPPRSMSPLLKKVANTQSDKWPKPDQAPVRGKVVLPSALAPPPGGGNGFRKPAAQDLLAMGSPVPESDAKQGTGSVFAMMQAQAPSPVVGGGGAVGSSFVLPPPPGSRQFTPPVPPPKIGLPTFTSSPPVRPASVTNGASAKGGLSAADLSFFEGL